MISSTFTRSFLIVGIALTLLLSLIIGNLNAASDGSLGATSTGSFQISITVPPMYKVSGFADLDFGTWDASSALAENDDLCIYTNVQTGSYRVTLAGDGSGGAFTVDDGQGNNMPYTAYWNDVTGVTGSVQVTSGTPLLGQTGACTNSFDCKQGCGNNTANVEVRFSQSTLGMSRAGVYTGNLAVTVEPD